MSRFIIIPPLPEGFEGTLDDYGTFIMENATVEDTSGGGTTGGGSSGSGFQVGGTRPTQDVGPWFGPNGIEVFTNGAYQPITDTPIGSVLPWASALATPPENYLICDGRSILRADYQALFLVCGTIYGTESGTTFNVPDLRGRYPVGTGTGDYIKQGINGKMAALPLSAPGPYFGMEWPKKTPLSGFPGAPTAAMKTYQNEVASVANYTADRNPCVAVQYIVRYR